MKPIEFDEMTQTIQRPKNMTDEQCSPLPAIVLHADGYLHFVSCWKMTWKERLSAFFKGLCWLSVINSYQPPVSLTLDKPYQLRKCRICGCTDADCSQCIAVTGRACHWVAEDLCSRCHDELEAL